jgi:N-dimethylarginine dimethylaminohydrolase
MRPDVWRAIPASRQMAAQASTELHQAIELIGGSVEIIEGIEGLPNLVFPANAAIVLDGRVLMARFR